MTGEYPHLRDGHRGLTRGPSGVPRYWSYTSLKEVEACPRSYSLSRAPTRISGSGAATRGLPYRGAVRRCRSRRNRMDSEGARCRSCSSATSAEAVAVLKSLGGYTAVAEQVLAGRLAQLDGNPRLRSDQRRRLERELGDRMPDARGEIQEYLSRIPPLPSVAPSSSSGDGETREDNERRLGVRSLVAHTPNSIWPRSPCASSAASTCSRWRRTGPASRTSRPELRIRATKSNSSPMRCSGHATKSSIHTGRPCCDLRAAYPNREAVFPPPDDDGLAQLESNLVARIRAADEAVETTSPERG